MRKRFGVTNRSNVVSRFLYVIILLSLAFSNLGSSPTQGAQSQQPIDIPVDVSSAPKDGALYYYSHNRRIPLTVATNTLMVRMSPGINVQRITEYLTEPDIQLSADEMAIQELDNGLSLVSLSQPVTAEAVLRVVANLSKMPDVELVGPAFDAQDAIMLATDEIIVQFEDDVSQDEVAALNRAMGTQIARQSPYVKNNYVLHAPLINALNVLAIANSYYENPLVTYAHPNFTRLIALASVTPNDRYYASQWHLSSAQYPDIAAPLAWDITQGSNDITIAVIDSGVDIGHPDLDDKVVHPRDCVDDDSDPTPPLADDPITGGQRQIESHGTAVAGIATAETDNDKEGVSGVCWHCKLMPIRGVRGHYVFYPNEQVWKYEWTDANLAAGINYAWQNGADVINLSWMGGTEGDAISFAIHDAVTQGRNGKGSVVLASAGNDDESAVSYPARLNEVIAVGATNKCDQRKTKTDGICGNNEDWGSNYGPEIAISAPGVNIWTTDVRGSGGYYHSPDYYPWFNGTSSATPIVSGIAGLLLSADPSLSAEQVKQILAQTADKVGGYSYSGSGPYGYGNWNQEMGYGRVNAYRALKAITSSPPPPPPPPCTDNATFTGEENYPDDGPPVSPGQAISKWWLVRNSGTCTWGSGYQLVFIGGNQMGAPSAVNVPGTVSPGATVVLSVAMTAPNEPGTHRGEWKLRNSQGVFFGDKLWIQITVPDDTVPTPPPPPSGSSIELTCLDCPAAVAPGQTFRPTIRARVNSGQLLESRGDMLRNTDGNLYGAHPHIAVAGTVNTGQSYDFTFYADNPITAPGSEGVYETKWRVWRDGHWDGDEITIRFNVQQSGGTNYPPNPPTLTGPGDWAIFQGTPVVLAVQHNGDPDGDAVTGYYFDLMGPNPTNSGWIGSNTWNPQGLPYSNYEWRVKVRDSRGAESGWSPQTWHFNVLNNEPEIYEFYSTTCRDAWGGPEKICFCAKTNAGTLQLMVNTATDGSDQGEWRIINELGVPEYRCQDDSDRPPNTDNLEWETGTHRARLYARREGGWENAAYRDITFSLPAERRPNDPITLLPAHDTHVNSKAVHFDWRETLRTTDYHLVVGTNPDPGQNPLLDVHTSPGLSEHIFTFDDDYPTLYWKVTATGPYGTNDYGSQFHIDIDPPSSNVNALPAVTTETIFPVNWSGSDARSGLRWYDVQFRDGERGEWVTWMAQTTLTSALFRGEPGHTYYFRVRAMDEVGNWEAYPPGGGDTHTLVDPTAAPPTTWWNEAYGLKRNIIVLNNDGHTMPANYPVHLHFDSSTIPTAEEVYNASQSAVKGDDFRIAYNNTTELDRQVQSFSPTEINIWFPLQADLSGHQSSEGDYQLYYDNPSATNPPADVNAVFLPIADGNTVALWHFQEGNGSTVFDNSGHNHNGTFHSADWVAGFLGTAGKFNGSSAYVDAGNSDDFNLAADPMTIEAWIYLTGSTGDYPHVVSKWGPGDGSYFLRIMGGRNPQWLMRSGGDVAAGTSLELNKWHHVAATYDGVNTMRIFINGGQAANKTDAKNGLASTRRLFIGWAEEGADGGHFPGYIQHVRISNTDRSDFPYARVTESPSLEAGSSIPQPSPGISDLVIKSLTTYPATSGGILVQAVVRNEGDAPTTNGFYTDLYADHQPSGAGDYTGSVRFWIASSIEASTTVTLTTVLTDATGVGGLSAAALGPLDEITSTLYTQADSEGIITEPDDADNISSGVDVCIASADAYEGDDIPADAQPIALGEAQRHNFDSLGDQDWVTFTAQGGVTYTIQTSDLGQAADTYLYLYDTDGSTLLAANDDYGGSLASRIEWTAPVTGTYYLLVKHWNPNVAGCGSGYVVRVAVAVAPVAASVVKTVTPRGLVNYGDELTYTLVISAELGAQVALYDPLTQTNFLRFAEPVEGITHANRTITGTLTITPTNRVTVSFVVQVSIPGTAGWTVTATNKACVYPFGGTLGGCVWSNDATNPACRPYGIYLPLVLRNY